MIFELDPRPRGSAAPKAWRVMAYNGDFMGYIVWSGHMRGYTLNPQELTSFTGKSLRTIADFCDHHTKTHKEKRVA